MHPTGPVDDIQSGITQPILLSDIESRDQDRRGKNLSIEVTEDLRPSDSSEAF